MNAETNEISDTWYHELLKDLRELACNTIVGVKWKIGKRMIDEEEHFGKREYGSRRVENVASDLNISPRDLWFCIQFAKKYPNLESEPLVQNMSWRKIRSDMLPEQKKEPTKQKTLKIEFADWAKLLEWHNLEQPEIKKIVVHYE